MRIPLLIVLLCLAAVSPASAQTTETPVPFDTAGRIVSMNPPLAARLGLAAPAWPVTGTFIEARLFRVSTGGHALAVTRSDGSVDRFALSDSQTAALREAFAAGVGRAGRVVAEDAANVISEPARGPFVRDQMLLASIIYGPALAALTDDGAVGTGLYMMSVGGTFFGLNDFARRRTITKAQNALTTDGALRGWAGVALTTNLLSLDLSKNGAALTALAGGIGGSMVGYHRGRTLTNSEAAAAMTASTLGAGALLGAAAAVGIIGENGDRAASGAILLGGIGGYVVGPAYPRRASYTVTAADVSVVRMGAFLGAMAAITPFVEADIDGKAAAGLLTAGWVGGALFADYVGARPFNHSEGDARMMHLGALGGSLMGAAIPLMTRSESPTLAMAMVTGGAILGTMATQNMMAPARAGEITRSGGRSDAGGAKVEFAPQGALLAAAGRRGNHTLLRLRF